MTRSVHDITHPDVRPHVIDPRACSAAGQSGLISLYDSMFAQCGISVAQLLLSKSDFDDSYAMGNLSSTVQELLQIGVVPILNENDAMARPPAADSKRGGMLMRDNDSLAALVGVLLSVSGCAETRCLIGQCAGMEIKRYHNLKTQIQLGDSIDKVLPLMNKAQKFSSAGDVREPDRYIRNGKNYYIHYVRSAWVGDGKLSDDEITPYIFENGKLVGIGWRVLGGGRNFSSPPPPDNSPHTTNCRPDGVGGVRCTSY